MTFEDLPANWDQRPLTDPAITADAIDLFISARDREAGAIYLFLCDADGHLLQPVAIGLDNVDHSDEAGRLFGNLGHLLGSLDVGGVIVAVARAGYRAISDADRAWHQGAITMAQAHDIPLLGTYVVTHHDVVRLPEPLTGRAARTA